VLQPMPSFVRSWAALPTDVSDPSTCRVWDVGREWAYRLSQGFIRLLAALFPPNDQFAAKALKPDELRLFRSMAPADRRHGLCVANRLAAHGVVDADVLAAALLHDAGKVGGGLNLLRRTSIVLLGPRAVARIAPESMPSKGGWRRALWVHRHHAELGAQRCAHAGSSPLVVELVRLHDVARVQCESEVAWRLELLRDADDRC